MTFLGVHATRLEVLIENGLRDEELRQFFETSKKRLLIAGARVQTLPRNKQEAVRVVLHFSSKAHDVLREWLSKQPHTYPEELKNQLITRFQAIEQEGVEPEEDETLQLFRCGLDALYGESPPAQWLAFLATNPEDEQGPSERDIKPSQGSSGLPATVTAESIQQYAQCIVGDHGNPLISDPTLQLAAKLTDAILSGNEKIIGELPEDPSAYPILRRLISETILRHRIPLSGVHALAPPTATFDSARNYLALEIVATASRIAGNGPYFLDVEAFLDGGKAFTLNMDDLRDVLPDEGRIIHFGDSRHPPVIAGQPACYRVERFDTSKPIKVRVLGIGRHLLPVKYVPHPSSDHDLVRQWIQAYAEVNQSGRAVFVTNDGLCLAPRVDPLKRVLTSEYDWMLDAWPSIDALELNSGAFVLAPLPSPLSKNDYAPLATVARRLLKRSAESGALKLTKQQIIDIAEKIGNDDSDLDAARQNRVRSRVQLLAQSDVDYDQLVKELMISPAVRQDVEARKQQEVEIAALALSRERQALENVKKEKASIERKLTQLKREVDDHAKEVRAAVRKAFDGAKLKEGETIGQLALWQTLLQGLSGSGERRSSVAPVTQSPPTQPAERLTTTKFSGGEHLEDSLLASGFPEKMIKLYGSMLRAAVALAIPVTVTGPGASSFALRLARSLSSAETLCIDVPIGLVTDAMQTELFDAPSPGPIVLRNANLSDLSIYSPRLLDHISQRVSEPLLQPQRPAIFFAGASGSGALPWPDEVRFFTAKLDLAESLREGNPKIWETSTNATAPLQQKLCQRVRQASEANATDEGAYALLFELIYWSKT